MRNHQQIIFNILSNIEQLNSKESILDLLANDFYDNILILNYLDDEFLALIYRLLKLEISQLQNTKNKKQFLLNSNCGNLLKQICNNNEIKSFFNMLLKPIVENMEMQSEFKWVFNLKSIQEIIDNYKIKHNQENVNELYKPQIDIYDLRNSLSDTNTLLTDFNEIKNANEKRRKEEMDIARKYFFDKYIQDLKKEELEKFMNSQNDIRMKQFCQRQLNRIKDDNDLIYANQKCIEQMMDVENSAEVLTLYQTYFSYIKNVIDSILKYLIENMHLIPYSIKCICKMISILIKKKFNDISEIEENSYICNFFFQLLFFEIFKYPDYKGLIANFIISPQTKSNIETTIKIIGKLAKGNFFKATKDPEYTPFNWYFLYTMPLLLEFIDKLKNIQLPSYLEKLSNGSINDNDFSYDYFKENNDEIMHYQSICFCLNDFVNIFFFVNKNVNDILNLINDENEKNEFNEIVKKLNYHIDQIKKIIDNDKNKLKIYYFIITKVILSDKISNSYNLKENDIFIINNNNLNDDDKLEKTFLDIEKYFILLLSNFHNLEEEDFFDISTNSINILKEIIQLINLDKIQKKEIKNEIPTEWYGKILLKLLNELPDEYKENDYLKVYEDFKNNIIYSMNNLDFSQLSEMSEKIKSVNQLSEIVKQNEKLLKNAKINNKILKFVEEQDVNILFKIDNEKKNKIIFYDEDENKRKEKIKKSEFTKCKTLKELINEFPSFISYIDNSAEFDKTFTENFIKLNKKIKNDISKYFNLNKKTIDESEAINEKIMNFFMSNIYDKLFNSQIQEKDHTFYKKCVSFSWIELKDLIGENNLILDNFLPIIIKYIEEIETARTPKKKLELISQIKRVINDTYIFNTGKSIMEVDEYLPSFVFALIKAKPKKAISNLNFIKVFFDSSKEQSVTFFESAIQFLSNLSYDQLKNISKEEFEKKSNQVNNNS